MDGYPPTPPREQREAERERRRQEQREASERRLQEQGEIIRRQQETYLPSPPPLDDGAIGASATGEQFYQRIPRQERENLMKIRRNSLDEIEMNAYKLQEDMRKIEEQERIEREAFLKNQRIPPPLTFPSPPRLIVHPPQIGEDRGPVPESKRRPNVSALQSVYGPIELFFPLNADQREEEQQSFAEQLDAELREAARRRERKQQREVAAHALDSEQHAYIGVAKALLDEIGSEQRRKAEQQREAEEQGRIIYALTPEQRLEQRREREQQREAQRRALAEQYEREEAEREAEQRFAESERLRTEHREAQRRALAEQYEREEAEREAAEQRTLPRPSRQPPPLRPSRQPPPRPSRPRPPILRSEEEQRFLDFLQSLPRAPTHRPVITPEMASSMRNSSAPQANRLDSRYRRQQQERESQNRLRMLRRESERREAEEREAESEFRRIMQSSAAARREAESGGRRIVQSSAAARREDDDEKCIIGPCLLMYGAKKRRHKEQRPKRKALRSKKKHLRKSYRRHSKRRSKRRRSKRRSKRRHSKRR